jgi:hypothetical protein
LKEIRTYANPDVKLFLIGNKADLETKREVSKERALRFRDDNKILYFAETSAKAGINCNEIFIQSAKILYEDYLNVNSNSRKESTYRPYDTNTRLPKIEDDINGRHTIKIDPSKRISYSDRKCKC